MRDGSRFRMRCYITGELFPAVALASDLGGVGEIFHWLDVDRYRCGVKFQIQPDVSRQPKSDNSVVCHRILSLSFDHLPRLLERIEPARVQAQASRDLHRCSQTSYPYDTYALIR